MKKETHLMETGFKMWNNVLLNTRCQKVFSNNKICKRFFFKQNVIPSS